MGNYTIKDPIYGYMYIPREYMIKIVDTACFQRIRRIIQSSYSPLYPTAVHNRFGHSLGVFHLGNKASRNLVREIVKKFSMDEKGGDEKSNEAAKKYNAEMRAYWKKMGEIFNLACLLHDVGHAPFSHTGEDFFLTDGKYQALHEELKKLVGTDSFSNDIPKKDRDAAKPHEIMSAIIGIEEFSEKFYEESEHNEFSGKFFGEPEQKEFFARCIIGYLYSKKDFESQVKNCFISMLNGKVIDVDKLDYLIRDSYVLGFASADIDYERLLNNLTIVKMNGKYEIAYYKNAISTIENIVYAHDSERKWLQTQPVVLYESYLLRHFISHLCEKLDQDGKKLFSHNSLTKRGERFDGGLQISLLSDDDIIYLMKNTFSNSYSEEYLDRTLRYRPVWRSEAEYKALFVNGKKKSEAFKEIEKVLSEIAKYIDDKKSDGKLNQKLIEKLDKDIADIERSQETDDEKEKKIEDKERMKKMVNCLIAYQKSHNISHDFIIMRVAQFYSNFGKPAFGDIKISFPVGNKQEKIAKVEDILASLKAREKDHDNDAFFYLFYKDNRCVEKGYSNISQTAVEISDMLLEAFGEERTEKSDNTSSRNTSGTNFSYRAIKF